MTVADHLLQLSSTTKPYSTGLFNIETVSGHDLKLIKAIGDEGAAIIQPALSSKRGRLTLDDFMSFDLPDEVKNTVKDDGLVQFSPVVDSTTSQMETEVNTLSVTMGVGVTTAEKATVSLVNPKESEKPAELQNNLWQVLLPRSLLPQPKESVQE